MATYNLADLTFRDGKLYAGTTPLTARDNIGIYKPTSDAAPSFLGNDSAGINYQLPLWAALGRWDSFLPSAPAAQEGDMSWLNGSSDPYAGIRSNLGAIEKAYAGQVDPFLEFTNTGDNRDALYGAYMWGQNNGGRDTTEMTSAITPQSSFDYSSGAFDNRVQLPDLLKNYTGETYSDTGAFKSPYASQAADEAQALLKRFYPNATQEQLDRAAYAALQSGVRYSSDLGTQFNDTSNWYYGGGPLPTVKAIAGQLGGVTPALQTFLDQNWKTYADKYAGLREQAQAAQDAEDAGMVKSGLGALGVFGGLALAGAGGLGNLLGGSAAGAETGGGMSWLSDLGDWASNLFGGDTQFAAQDIVDLFNNAGTQGYDQLGNLLSSDDQIFNLFENAGMPGFDQYGAPVELGSATDIISKAKNYVTQNPGSTMKTALQALTGSSDLSKLLGGLASAGLGAYASSQQSNDLNALAKRYEGYGAPYRAKLASLYADPSSFLKDPSVTASVDQGTNALMRSLSTQGNPFGSGNALQQGQDYATKGLYSELGREKDRLAGFGGLTAYNQAAPQAATNSIAANGGMYNAIGSGMANIFNPPQTDAQANSALMRALRGY